VFIIHGNDKIEPPFGTWAYYDPKEGVTVKWSPKLLGLTCR
jgi:hypothetical protein